MGRTRHEIFHYEVTLGTLTLVWRVKNGLAEVINERQASAMEGREAPSADELAAAAQVFEQAARDAGLGAAR